MRAVPRIARSWLFVLVVVLLASPVRAQTGTAALIGEVTDPQKQVVPGATVTLTNRQTGVERTTVSDERGQYRFTSMQPPAAAAVRVSGRLTQRKGNSISKK